MAKEFGWAYVAGTQASGPKGSVQLAGTTTALDHDPNLIWSDEDNALLVSGNIIAHNFEIQNQTKTVFHFEVSGSSVFGDTEDDLHQFTGSLDITGNVTALSYYGYGGDLEGVAINEYVDHGEYRLVTSVDEKSVKANENLLFNGTLLSVTGNIQALEINADEISGTLGFFDDIESITIETTELSSSAISSSVAVISNPTFGDVVLTGRIIDANGNVILGTSTAQTEVNISSTGVQTSISSNTFTNANQSNAVGMDYVVVEEGIEVGTNAFVAKLGAMGVGTNLPQARVEIYKEGGNQLRLSSIGASQLTSGGGFLFNPLKHHTDIQTDSNGLFSIVPTGQRVGINTVTPEHSLDVYGDARITGNLIISGTLSARMTDFSVSADTLTFGDESTDIVVMNAATMSTPNGLSINSDMFLSNGNVGVGAQSSGGKFEVVADSNQMKIGTSTKHLSVDVTNTSTTLSTNNEGLDIDAPTKVLNELRVGSNGDIVLDNAGQLSSSVSVSSTSGYFTNLTSSMITNGGTTINSGSIDTDTVDATTVNSYWVNANVIAGRLTTANQTNISSVGTLSYLNVANATKLQGTLSVGTNNTSRKAEIKDSNPQLRLTNTDEVFGLTSHTYADMHATGDGDLSLLPSSGKVIVPSLKLTNVPQGQSTLALAVDQNGNVITTSFAQSGIEVRNRTVTTTSYNMQTSDYFVALRANEDIVVTLPDASTLHNGQIFVITDEIGSAENYTLTLRAAANQYIDGLSEIVLVSPRSSVSVYTDGQSNFFIF